MVRLWIRIVCNLHAICYVWNNYLLRQHGLCYYRGRNINRHILLYMDNGYHADGDIYFKDETPQLKGQNRLIICIYVWRRIKKEKFFLLFYFFDF